MRLLISSLPGSASRKHVELLVMLHDSTSVLKAEPGKLDIKKYAPGILNLYSIPHAFFGNVVAEGCPISTEISTFTFDICGL